VTGQACVFVKRDGHRHCAGMWIPPSRTKSRSFGSGFSFDNRNALGSLCDIERW